MPISLGLAAVWVAAAALLGRLVPPPADGRRTLPRFVTVVLVLLAAAPFLAAQPTYKLDVKPNLKPEAQLQLDGFRVTRTAVKDDPGFRLQYHLKQAGKTVSTIEARTIRTT